MAAPDLLKHLNTFDMNTLLEIKTSIFSDHGQSSQLAARYVERWRHQHPGASVVTRDLARDPVQHLTAQGFEAFLTPAESRSTEQAAIVAFSDALIAELETADTIVLALPMYNFGVPSALKAYIDHVARAGRTFRYTEKGPAGLLHGKNAVVIATRGGLYAGTPLDTEGAYVRTFLHFIGIDDIAFIFAEGLALGEPAKAAALAKARDAIDALLPGRAAA